jgi:hypothetical protein
MRPKRWPISCARGLKIFPQGPVKPGKCGLAATPHLENPVFLRLLVSFTINKSREIAQGSHVRGDSNTRKKPREKERKTMAKAAMKSKAKKKPAKKTAKKRAAKRR